MRRKESWLWSVLTVLMLVSLVAGACAAPMAPVAPGQGSAEGDGGTSEGASSMLTIALNGQPVRLLPSQAVGRINEIVNTMMFESLTTHDQDGQLVGLLAESYTNIDDLTWEFKLRPDVTFSNGDPMTAEDVKFTYDQLILNADAASASHLFMNTIAEVQVVDPLYVRIVTTQPDVMLPLRVFDITGNVVPKKYFEEVGAEGFDENPVGTVRTCLKNGSATAISPSHAMRTMVKRPPTSQSSYASFPYDAARVATLLAGEVDLASNIPPARVAEIEASDDVEARSAAGTPV